MNDPHSDQVRWKQRFENLTAALASLDEALDAAKREPDNRLYQIALIGAFTFTYELGWKTLKDYLKFGGISLTVPRDVIKQAFNSGLIADGQTWIDMIDDRNLMSHAYDKAAAAQAVQNIRTRYRPAIEQVYRILKSKLKG